MSLSTTWRKGIFLMFGGDAHIVLRARIPPMHARSPFCFLFYLVKYIIAPKMT
jgi:hypothetical protein